MPVALERLRSEHLKVRSRCDVKECAFNDIDPEYNLLVQSGLLKLSNEPAAFKNALWQDVLDYCHTVIKCPEDTSRRANATWIRSTSSIFRQLMQEFGPDIIKTAKRGCESLVADYYHGDSSTIAHVNKKANFMRHIPLQAIGSFFYPPTSPLAIGCYETGTLTCSIALSAWLPPKQAVIHRGNRCRLRHDHVISQNLTRHRHQRDKTLMQ